MADAVFFILMAGYLGALLTCAYFMLFLLEDLFAGNVRFRSTNNNAALRDDTVTAG